jgi:hypothetical protein
MSLLTVVKDVCAAVGVMVPQTVFGGINSNRTMQEMLALANEMAQRIAYDTRDWTALRAIGTLIGTGAQTDWPLPANYKRMPVDANVWSSVNTMTPLRFVPSADEWMQRRLRGYTESLGEWTMMGGSMLVLPAIASGATVTFPYLDKNCVRLTAGGYGDHFMDDADSFRLDERLLKLGMIWQWMANKGSPYAEPMGTYSDALANAMGHDAPAPIIIGQRPSSAHARVAYPWSLPS